MDRLGKLFIFALLAVALGVGAWFALSPTPPLASLDPATGSEATAESSSLGAAQMAADTTTAARGPERAEVQTKAPAAETDPEITAALAKFVGRVVEFDGKPAGARVVKLFRIAPQVVLQPNFDLMAAPIPDLDGAIAGETTTAADGRFELPGLWPQSIFLLKADVGGTNPTIKLVDRTPAPAETCDLGDIVLKNGATVTGRVVDESGDPIAGATVRAADIPAVVTQFVPVEQFDLEGFVIGGRGSDQLVMEMPGWVKKYWAELPIPTATTDGEGRFTLTGIEPGLNMVAATKSGLVAAVQKGVKLTAGQKRDLGKLVMREGEVATGRVVTAAGKPVAGAEVIVGMKLNGVPVTLTRPVVRCDAQGKFECAGLGRGDVVAAARREPGERWTVESTQSVAKELVITLPSRHTLNLRLVSEPGLPIATPRLRLVAAFGDETDALPVMAAMGFAREVSIAAKQTTLPDGRIQIRDLDAGTYVLVVAADKHAYGSRKIELTNDLDVELRLPAESAVDVTVLDARGKGIKSAAIFVESNNSGPESMPHQAGRTDSEGKLHARVPRADSAQIQANHPRYGVVSGEVKLPAGAPLVLTFQDPGKIAGVVTDGGKPPELGRYMVLARRPWPEARGPITGMPLFQPIGADGKFEFAALQPGKWVVEVVKSLDAIRSFGSMTEMMWSAWEGQEMPEQEVILAAGTTSQVQLDLSAKRVVEGPSARVSGTAYVDGQPAAGMLLYGWGQGRVSGTIDNAGRFDLGQVREGHIWLNLADRSDQESGPMRRSLWAKSLEVKGGKDITLDIVINTGTVSGVVTAHDGRPAAGVNVQMSASHDGVSHNASGVTDANGRFEIKRVPTGEHTVSASAVDMGRGNTKVTVTAGTHTNDVRLQLNRTYTVKGNVDMTKLPKHEDGDWAYVVFEPIDGKGQSSGVSVDRDDGTFAADDVSPGKYRIRVHCAAPGEWFHESDVEVLGDTSGLRIVPVKVEPKPQPKPEAKKD